MEYSTESIIAIVALALSSISCSVCGYMLCKRVENQKQVNESRIIKVKSYRDIKAQELLHQIEYLKKEFQEVRDDNKQLINNNKELIHKMKNTIHELKNTGIIDKVEEQKALFLYSDEWTGYYDENHKAYYWYSKYTNETTWTCPITSDASADYLKTSADETCIDL